LTQTMSFRGAGHKGVYARLRRAMARAPRIHDHEPRRIAPPVVMDPGLSCYKRVNALAARAPG